jgi:hypothetical protein
MKDDGETKDDVKLPENDENSIKERFEKDEQMLITIIVSQI